MTKNLLRILIATFSVLVCATALLRAGAEEVPGPGNDVVIDLTEEERAFLAGKELRLCVDDSRPPFEFFDEKGGYAGMSAEFIQIISKRLGVAMIPQKGVEWTDGIKKAKAGEIDLIPKMTPTPEREKSLLFTRPYTTFPSVIVTRKDRFVQGLDDLVGLKVGVIKGLIIDTSLKRDRPDLTLVPLPDLESALRDLSTGKVDVFIDNLGTVTYTIDKVGLANLKIAAPTPYTHDLAIGVRKDWPLVASALDKALASITDQEKAQIKNRWLAIQYGKGIEWRVVGPVGAGLLGLTAFVLIWNRRLGRAVRERERTELILRDQAEELQAQQDILRETEAWFRGIIESAPDGILVADDRGMIILANTMVDRMFGYESGELLGKNVDTLVPAADRAGQEFMREGFMRTGAVREMGSGLNLRGVRKDGLEYPVEIGLSKLPATGSRGPCVCASIRDITERKQAEAALKESEERSRLLLESAGEGIFGVDTSGKMTFVNPASLRMLGYQEEELLGQKIHPIIHHSYADGSPYPPEKCSMAASFRQGDACHVTDEVLWRKDGAGLPVDYSSTPIHKDGQVVGAVVTFRDITERKKVEEELKQYVKDLERFNRLVVGREIRMIQLKDEINELRTQLGQSAKYMVGGEPVGRIEEVKLFSEERDESVFNWGMIGNIAEGRPNLGSTIDVGVYRLMHFALRDVMVTKFDTETAEKIFYEAGEQTGRELYRAMLSKGKNFEDFIREAKDLLANLKIGILGIEKSNLEEMNFTITLSEDLGCSGMPVSHETICTYDEGFLSGLLLEHTGTRFGVREVDCWCTGNRLCRFDVRRAE